MSKRSLSVLLFIFSIGAIRETYRIYTSDAADISANRSSLIIMSLLLTSGLIFAAIRLWIKRDGK